MSKKPKGLDAVASLNLLNLAPGSRVRFTTKTGSTYELRRLDGDCIQISGTQSLPDDGTRATLHVPYARLTVGNRFFFHPEGYDKGITTSPVQSITRL